MDIKTDIDAMKSLLELYETYRDDAQANKDGFGYKYWSNRCAECLSIMERIAKCDDCTENNPK